MMYQIAICLILFQFLNISAAHAQNLFLQGIDLDKNDLDCFETANFDPERELKEHVIFRLRNVNNSLEGSVGFFTPNKENPKKSPVEKTVFVAQKWPNGKCGFILKEKTQKKYGMINDLQFVILDPGFSDKNFFYAALRFKIGDKPSGARMSCGAKLSFLKKWNCDPVAKRKLDAKVTEQVNSGSIGVKDESGASGSLPDESGATAVNVQNGVLPKGIPPEQVEYFKNSLAPGAPNGPPILPAEPKAGSSTNKK